MESGTAAGLLVRARARAGVSQTEMARRADVPRSVVCAYEHGRRQPGADMLERLLSAVGFRLVLAPRSAVDPTAVAQQLPELLELADALPSRRHEPLRYPRLPATLRTGRPDRLSHPGLPATLRTSRGQAPSDIQPPAPALA
jgi:transcriptional regulator with XRE-family HTH domain